jgi:hypothetical protein
MNEEPIIFTEEDNEEALKYVADLWDIEEYLDIYTRAEYHHLIKEVEEFEDLWYPM